MWFIFQVKRSMTGRKNNWTKHEKRTATKQEMKKLGFVFPSLWITHIHTTQSLRWWNAFRLFSRSRNLNEVVDQTDRWRAGVLTQRREVNRNNNELLPSPRFLFVCTPVVVVVILRFNEINQVCSKVDSVFQLLAFPILHFHCWCCFKVEWWGWTMNKGKIKHETKRN